VSRIEPIRTRPIRRRLLADATFKWACATVTFFAIAALGVLLVAVVTQGLKHLDWDFLTSGPSRRPERAGFQIAMIGSLWLMVLTALLALPLGVGSAVYLEEFAPKNRITRFIQLNIANLAGVPSIVYGMVALTAFGRFWGLLSTQDPIEFGNPESFFYFRMPFGNAVVTGALALTLVVLPVVVIASQEALRAVPPTLRQSSRALGATRWQTVAKVTLPAALPGIMTGAILSMSRAIGEAAPLLAVGASLFMLFTPDNLMSQYTAMPLQIFNWAGRPQADFHDVAASGIIVLLGVLLTFNAIAVFIRAKFQKPLQ
jgi:phosphate transport system permease protein